jgi:phosphate transport system substrate-binding protein
MFRKKAGILGMLCILLGVLLVVGCSKSTEQKQGNDQNGSISGNIQLAGSTSVQPLAEELAGLFMEQYPEVKIDVQGGGSSAGIKAASDGIADIGMASRELKDEEKDLGLNATVIAKDGIAVIVNPTNKVGDLTLENIKKIFTGEIANWKEIGGADAAIVVVNREEGSGTRGAFEELVLGKETKFTDKAAIQNSTGSVRTAVASDPNAIGYVSMGALEKSVKAVKVGGIEINSNNVVNGTYKISRPFLFLTKGEPKDLTKKFIDLILSDEGQKIVEEDFVPINK